MIFNFFKSLNCSSSYRRALLVLIPFYFLLAFTNVSLAAINESANAADDLNGLNEYVVAFSHPLSHSGQSVPDPIAEFEEKEKEDEKNHFDDNLVPQDIPLHAHDHFSYQHFSDSFSKLFSRTEDQFPVLIHRRYLFYELFLI
jgi:hypothetical protein